MYIGNVHLIHDEAVVAKKTMATAFSDIIKAGFMSGLQLQNYETRPTKNVL